MILRGLIWSQKLRVRSIPKSKLCGRQSQTSPNTTMSSWLRMVQKASLPKPKAHIKTSNNREPNLVSCSNRKECKDWPKANFYRKSISTCTSSWKVNTTDKKLPSFKKLIWRSNTHYWSYRRLRMWKNQSKVQFNFWLKHNSFQHNSNLYKFWIWIESSIATSK